VSLQTERLRDIQQIVNDDPTTCTWGGVEFVAKVSSIIAHELTPMDEGYDPGAEIQLTATVADLRDLRPAQWDEIIVGNDPYVVSQIRAGTGFFTYRLRVSK
jgi:hypothetical protein